jgi:predicted nucleic acid-binding protein
LAGAPETLVINTGPLISLGRAGALDILTELPIRFVTPTAVVEEIAEGARLGHPIDVPTWVEVISLRSAPSPLVVQSLDAGEAAVISLALERGITTVGIDEWRGRRIAKAAGLEVTGSLGLLGRAKTYGILPELKPWIARLAAGGARFDGLLIKRFLQAFGEG